MLDWLIVGGGVHGTYFSHVLTGPCGFGRDRVRVLDPHDDPLRDWFQRARGSCMDFLRSPGVHHIDVEPFSLLHFSRGPAAPASSETYGVYNLPSACLFEAHAHATMERRRSRELRLRGSARALARVPGGWRVETDAGAIETRRVLLALGPARPLNWPSWASSARAGGGRVEHVLARSEYPKALGVSRVAVIGSGCTAAHVVLSLARERVERLTWITTEGLRHAEYDSDPGWLGPKYLSGFEQVRAPEERRRSIQRARQPGSIPERLLRPLRMAIARQRVELVTGRVREAAIESEGRLALTTLTGTRLGSFDLALLATGFAHERPGGLWLREAEADLGLATAPCGYPLLAPSLEWRHGLLVAGELAELELGPTARNIGGARIAAERLVRHWRAA